MKRTHDYTDPTRRWGHDYTFHPTNGGWSASMSGWGRGLRRGDYLLLSHHQDKRTTRYQIHAIKYESDPRDMWHATVIFAPRRGRLTLRERVAQWWRGFTAAEGE